MARTGWRIETNGNGTKVDEKGSGIGTETMNGGELGGSGDWRDQTQNKGI